MNEDNRSCPRSRTQRPAHEQLGSTGPAAGPLVLAAVARTVTPMSRYPSSRPSPIRTLRSAAAAARHRWDTLSGPYRVLATLAVVATFVVPLWVWLRNPLLVLAHVLLYAPVVVVGIADVVMIVMTGTRGWRGVSEYREAVHAAELRRVGRLREQQREYQRER